MEILQGAILGAFILGMVCILWFKIYPKKVKDLECSRCFCNETCSKLRGEKKPSGRKHFVED